ncbi:MAG: DUF1553 domain-containing protein [Planctomycetaceae bacterium]
MLSFPRFSRSLGSLGLAMLFTSQVMAANPISYNQDVRPILAENCFACHGADSASRKADLRLDKREAAVEATAIVPNKPDESEMIKRILSKDPETIMPPPTSHKQIKPEQIAILRQWIESGAEYQAHWSFIPPTRPELPKVKNTAWAKTPIDLFVLAKLEARGLTPAAEADRYTLARRVSLDLTGLPPSPELVESFVNDKSDNAYEKLVDKLLESKSWGEHRARYWLDLARYADSHGIHFDNYREMWSYREWVIKAFNRNMPYDQFTIEQLAGDLLPNRTLDQQIASGFNRCNITTSEGGAIDEEYRVLYARDRTETTAQVWMGLTAGCAVCHNHKFDPISQREFYAMSAFFNNTTQNAMDGNIKDTPPIVFVPNEADAPRWAELDKELIAAKQALDARKAAGKPDFQNWLASEAVQKLASSIPQTGLQFQAPLKEGEGNKIAYTSGDKAGAAEVPSGITWEPGILSGKGLQIVPGETLAIPDAGDFERDQPFSFGAWIYYPEGNPVGSAFARMDDQNGYRGWDLWFEGGSPAIHLINNWDTNALKVVSQTPLKAKTWSHVLVTYDGSSKAEGVSIYINGVKQGTRIQKNALTDTTKTTVPLKLGQRHTGSRINNLRLQDLRIYNRQLSPQESDLLVSGSRVSSLASKPADQRAAEEVEELYSYWLKAIDPAAMAQATKVAQIEAEQGAIKARGTIAHVMQEKPNDAMAFILFRGEYDKRRDEVKPETPAALPAFPEELPRNRLGFAKWLLLPNQPLTSRVAVNHYWQELFGTGIVSTSGDFGITGELPSHPELLDWMAVEFREKNWDIKNFYKMIVMSATYRQAATTTPEKLEKDAANRLLSRGPRFRMDAEMIRDYGLAASGMLVNKIGGPSVKPYQPTGVWEAVAMIGSNTRDYVPDQGDGLYRRSMYTFWKRSAPPASMDILNAPSRETCTVRRERTNTALQALVTLNDPQLVESARHLAQRALLASPNDTQKQIAFVSQAVLCRPLKEDELKVVTSSLSELQAFYASHDAEAQELIKVGASKPDANVNAKQLAALTMLVNELLNLDEVLCK